MAAGTRCGHFAFRSETVGHETGDMRVYCHEALHLQDKMQTAGYKPKVEKWDTDSDSDETDEEDLKV